MNDDLSGIAKTLIPIVLAILSFILLFKFFLYVGR